MDIDQLLNKARGGDEKAEKALFQYLFVRFRLLAKRRIGIEDSEDIAQEACLTVLEKYKNETFTKGFEAWSYGVLKMKIGNYIQGTLHKRKLSVPATDAYAKLQEESRVPAHDLKRDLLECLKKITRQNPFYARVLNLVNQGYKTDEICKRLGVTPNHYYVILNRGRKMLETCLEKGEIS